MRLSEYAFRSMFLQIRGNALALQITIRIDYEGKLSHSAHCDQLHILQNNAFSRRHKSFSAAVWTNPAGIGY